MDCSPLDSSVHGISRVRKLQWVAIFFSRASPRLRDWTQVSCIGRQILYHWATWWQLSLILFGVNGTYLSEQSEVKKKFSKQVFLFIAFFFLRLSIFFFFECVTMMCCIFYWIYLKVCDPGICKALVLLLVGRKTFKSTQRQDEYTNN